MTDTDIEKLIQQNFPPALTDACLNDRKCKKNMLKTYTKTLEVQQAVKVDSDAVGKVADFCLKDTDPKGCREKATKSYLGMLSARKSKETIDAVNSGFSLVKTLVIIGLYAFLAFAIYWIITNIVIWVQGITDAIKDISFGLPSITTTI